MKVASRAVWNCPLGPSKKDEPRKKTNEDIRELYQVAKHSIDDGGACYADAGLLMLLGGCRQSLIKILLHIFSRVMDTATNTTAYGLTNFNNTTIEQQHQRSLQNDFEDPNSFFASSSEEDEGLFPLLIIIPFFLLWNSLIGSHVTLALSFLMRGKCHETVTIMICPHWLVGIIIPAAFGFAWKGLFGSLMVAALVVGMPYSFFFVYHARTNPELQQYNLFWCKQPSDVLESSSSQVTELQDANIRERNESTSIESSNDLVIVKKVQKIPSQSKRHSGAKKETNTTNHSFRFNHPKSDIYIQKQSKKKTQRPLSRRAGAIHSSSIQLCAICLEEYQIGDEIAYSRNTKCHHAFHKNCVLELLEQGHDDCPICRNSYHVRNEGILGDVATYRGGGDLVDIELGER